MEMEYLKYGRDRNRELVRKRDDYTCQICHKKWQEGDRRFDCHHKQGCGILTRKYDRKVTLKNLITLCHRCHLKQESVMKKMGIKIMNYSERIKRNNEILELNAQQLHRGEIAKKFNLSEQMIYMIISKRSGWSNYNYGGNAKWKALDY